MKKKNLNEKKEYNQKHTKKQKKRYSYCFLS